MALQVAAGKVENATEAARAAGYTGRGAKVTACRMANDPRVRAIVDEERIKAARQLEREFDIRRSDLLQELAHLGFARLEDVISWGEDGYFVRQPSEIIERGRAALQEITITEDRIGPEVIRRRTKVKMHPKIDALMAAARLAGHLQEDSKPGSVAGVQIVINGGPTGLEAPPRNAANQHGRTVVQVGPG